MQETKRLLEIMAQLRNPNGGCPWDLEQTFASIVPYTLEEAYEVADAIERDDMPALREELGDLLLQVVFYAQMANEAGLFDFEAVAQAVTDKLVSRHPHVFSDSVTPHLLRGMPANPSRQQTPQQARGDTIKTAADQTASWDAIKAAEKAAKGHTSLLDDIPLGFPALLRAQKLTKKAAKVGFDWPDIAPVFAKLDEEVAELKEAIAAHAAHIAQTEVSSPAAPDAASPPPERDSASALRAVRNVESELGDVLFVCANLARHLKIDAETALRSTNRKFEARFRYIEDRLTQGGRSPEDASLEEMDALWDAAKAKGL